MTAAPTGIASDQLERLLEVGRSLVTHHDPEKVLRLVLDAACELTGARYAALGVLDEDGQGLDRFLTVGIDEEQRRAIGPLPRGHGILGELIRNPQPLRIAVINQHPRSYGFPAGHPEMSSFLGVPIRIRGRVFGNLYLTEKAGADEFDGQDESVVGVLAEWAAIAVDNARAHDIGHRRQADLRRAMRALEATVSLDREVGGEPDLQRVLELVVKRGRALVEARGCALLLKGELGLTIAEVAGELDRSLIGKTSNEEASALSDVLLAGRSQQVTGAGLSAFAGLGIAAETALLVPLISRGAELGVLCAFDGVDSGVPLDRDDLLALESLGTSAATAIHATQAADSEKLRLSIASSERERQRWARELHDETLQELGALSVLQDGAGRLDDPAAMRAAFKQSRAQVESIISGLRNLINELRPAALDELGVEAAVEALVARLSSRAGFEIELDVALDGESGRAEPRLSPELESIIYRTVQEALSNVVKHAEATAVKVAIEEAGGRVTITVDDDGRGIEAEGRGTAGFGLLGMRERAELVGGTLRITASSRGGTRVQVTLPVE